MKAAVTTGEKGKILVKDIPRPQVQPGSLLLKTKCCSICGTDLEYVDGSLEFLSEGSGKPRAGVSSVEAGKRSGMHKHGAEECFFVLRGRGKAIIDGNDDALRKVVETLEGP